ncbi:MAG: hypothetical protein KA004_05425 [Verrucomicrobiales bacterium]|nr:hypothetical protein [Verrucomicrobiales bacterium]
MRFAACSLIVAALGLAGAWSQNPPPTPPPPAQDPAKPTPPAAPAAAATSAGGDAAVVKERTVYVPFEDLAKTLANEGQGVFLPYREFLQMWNELNIQQKKEQIKSPADAVLSSLEYAGQVQGDAVSITATLLVESFKTDGWAVLPLVGAPLSIAKAETGEATLRLGEKGCDLLLPKAGKYTVKLDLMARVERNSGRQSVRLALPKAPVSRCTLTIPETGWEFRLAPAAAYTANPNAQGATELAFFFSEAENVEISWQKQGGESKLTPLIFAEMTQRVNAGAGTVQNKLAVDYRILRAGVETFVLMVPKPHEVLSVAGDNIKEWNLAPGQGDAPQELTVKLHAPARDAFRLEIDLEASVNALPAEVKVPAVEARDVVRQRGSLLLFAGPELDVTVKDLAGLSQQETRAASGDPVPLPAAANAAIPANANGAPAVPSAPMLGSYRYLKFPFASTLGIKRAEPVVEVGTATLVTVGLDATRFSTAVSATVKRAGIFNLRLQIPADFDSIEATGANVDGFKVEEADKKRFLDVRFKERVTSAMNFLVTGRRIRETPEEPVTLPVISPQNVSRHDAVVGVALHQSLDPNTKELGGLRQDDVANISTQLPASPDAKPQPKGTAVDGPATLAFRYRGDAAPAVITTRLKQSQVTGDVLTGVELKEQATRYHWWINYDIQYAGVDAFVIGIPKGCAQDVRIETLKDVKEVDKNFQLAAPAAPPQPEEKKPEAGEKPSPQQPAAGGELDYWKVTLRDQRMGAFVLELSLEVPIKDLGAGQAVDVTVPELHLQGVFQQIGQVAVMKDDNLEVLKAETANLETIDPKELREGLSRPGVILAYKRLRTPEGLRLSVSKNTFLEVPQAMVTHAVLRTVVSTDGGGSTEVVYWVKNNGLQFFTVELPPRGRMLSDVFVNGEAQQPMRRADRNDVLIRLPGSQSAAEFPIRFLYEVPAPAETVGKDLGLKGKFTVTPPKLNAGILQSQTTLYLPRDYVYLDFQGAMRPHENMSGWADPQSRLRWLIPALGPDIAPASAADWPSPPPLPAQGQGGFNLHLPQEGQEFRLYRLDAPMPVTVSYFSAKLNRAVRYIALLGVFLVGLMMVRRRVETKAAFFCFVGLGSLAARGFMSPSWAPLWESIWLGTLFALALWLVVGFVRCLAKLSEVPAKKESGGSTGGRSGGGGGPAAPVAPGGAPASAATAATGGAATPQAAAASGVTPAPLAVEPSQLIFREAAPAAGAPEASAEPAWFEQLGSPSQVSTDEPIEPFPSSEPPGDAPDSSAKS